MVIRDKWQFSIDQKRKKLKVQLLLSDNRILHQFIVDRIRSFVQLKKINNGGTTNEYEGVIGKKEYYRDSQKQVRFLIFEDNHFCFDLYGYNIHGYQWNVEEIQGVNEVELSVIDGSEFKIETLKNIMTLYHIQEFSVKGIKKIIDKRPQINKFYDI